MATFQFLSEQWLPRGREEIFRFFADAQNLQVVTPPWLDFQILTPCPLEMRPGAIIDYRLKVRRIPIRWQSEITAWEPPHRFVDTQRRGPYRQWIHEHRFEEARGGTACHDAVHYAVPGGRLVHWLVVRRDIRRIFEFRRRKLEELFGGSPDR